MKVLLTVCLGVSLLAALTGCGGSPSDPAQPRTGSPPAAAANIRFELHNSGLPSSGNWKTDPAIGDINGDGCPDLAANPRLEKSPMAWLNDCQGNWAASSKGLKWGNNTCGGDTVLADVNGDKKLDLVVADHCNGLFVFLGNGAGEWELTVDHVHPQNLPGASNNEQQFHGAESAAVGDVNGDGHADIVTIASDDGGLNVWRGDGTGRSFKQVDDNLPKTRYGLRVDLFDVNKDGKLDLLCTREEGPRCWLNNGDGTWRDFSVGFPSPVSGGIYNGLALGDVNNDGLVDVAVGNWIDGPEVYLQRSDGAWQKSPTVFPECKGGGWGIALADFDGDRNLDIAFCGRVPYDVGNVYGVFLLQGDGSGTTWRWLKDCGLPATGMEYNWGAAAADVNRDGVLDLIVTSGGITANAELVKLPIETRIAAWLGRRTKP